MKWYLKRLKMRFYDNDGGEGGNSPPPPPPPPPPATFNQDQVNAFLAKEKRKWEEGHKKTISELQRLQSVAGTSEEQIKELQGTIDSIQAQYMSKDELSKKEADKKAIEDKKKFDDLTASATSWQNQFTGLLVQNEIIKAATKHEAFNNEQMLTQLGGKSKVVPVIADGKPVPGQYQVVVTINDGDKVLEISADEAVKLMKGKPDQYGNLFKAGVNGGVGGGNNGGGSGGTVDLERAKKDPEYYRKNREKINNGTA